MYADALFSCLVILLSLVGISAAHAQSGERPPFSSVAITPQNNQALITSIRQEEPAESIIVRHSEPAILEDASTLAGQQAIAKLSTPHSPLRANALLQHASELRNRIDDEHRRFVTTSENDATLRGYFKQARVSQVKNILNATVIQGVPNGTLGRLRALGYRAEPALTITASLEKSVPAIGVSRVWSETFDSKGAHITGLGIRVGVIDTGIDYGHPDFGSCGTAQFLSGACARVKGGYDWVDNDSDPTDDNLHGTHVASIIGANGSVKGVAPDASLYALRVLDASGSGSSADIIRAIEWATDPNNDGDFSDHLDVINLSLGSSMGNADTADSVAADNAAAAGLIVVAAAGNAGPDPKTIGSPGAARQVITVGASLLNDTVAEFSSRGPVRSGDTLISKPDLVAPGVSICAALRTGASRSTCQDENHTVLTGTSMAAPHIAGVAALLKQARPLMSPAHAKALLKATARSLRNSLGEPLSAYEQGAGVVAALTAVQYALADKLPPVATLTTSGTLYEDSVSIVGSADGSNFEAYEVFLASTAGAPEQLIASGTSPIREAELGLLKVASLPSGEYTLRLVVRADKQEVQTKSEVAVRHVAILSPLSPREAPTGARMVYGSSDTIDIVGRVTGQGLQDYSLNVCWNFADDSGCAPQAVTPNLQTRVPTINGSLGTLDITQLTVLRRGLYTLKLTANYTDRASEVVSQELYLDPLMLRKYSPALRCDQNTPCEHIGQQPLLADVTNDGIPETIFSVSRYLHVINGDGSPLPGWPKSTDHSLLTPPSVGDIDGDGHVDIVVQGYDFLSSSRVRGAIYAFGADGALLSGWPSRFDVNPSAMRRYLGDFITVADIDGDTKAEVLLSPFECLSSNGAPCSTWSPPPISTTPEGFRMFGGLAIGDLDNDGDNEIVSTLTDWARWMRTGEERSLILVQDSTGTIISSTPVNSLIPTGPLITDVDGDGIREIATYDRSNVTDRVSIVIRDITGTPLPGWTASVPNVIFGDIAFSASFVAADLDANRSTEIAFQSDVDTHVIFYSEAQTSVRKPLDHRLSGYGSLVAANIDSDSASELIFVSRFYPHSFSEKDSATDPRLGLLALIALNDSLTLEKGFPILVPNSSGYLYPLAIGDIDGDTENEIAYPTIGEMVAFRTGGCANATEAWPNERATPGRHANSSLVALCSMGSLIFGECSQHSDQDLIDDCQDQCPLTNRLRPDPICGCSMDESDQDTDGTPNCVDLCPLDPLKKEPGVCGCFNAERDVDQDGSVDCGGGLATFGRPTAKPRIVRKRARYLKVRVPLANGASNGSVGVEVCLKKRGKRPRCRATLNGTAIFKPAPGPYTIYYTWRYSKDSSFRGPAIRTRISNNSKR
jgi:subtilisin family serine protease